MNTIKIKKVVNGGFGLAKEAGGMTILIPDVLPGEVVSYKQISKKKTYTLAKPLTINNAHPERVAPQCRYYDQCGGCNLMHGSYPLQLEVKQEIVKDLLQRSSIPTLIQQASTINQIIGSNRHFEYRQRIRLLVNEFGQCGYRKKNSHDIVLIDRCEIAHPSINSALTITLQSPEFSELLELSNEIELHVDPDVEDIVVILLFKRKPRPADKNRAISLLKAHSLLRSIIFKGDGFAHEKLFKNSDKENNLFSFTLDKMIPGANRLKLFWEAGGFCQVNIDQNMVMIKKCIELLEIDYQDNVLDLYCGMGNFSIPLALQAHSVIGIEGQGASIRSAKKNAAENGINNIQFLKKDIARGCDELLEKNSLFSIVILDPPRAGAPGIIEKICEMATDKVLYISCDPATLCRDLAAFLEKDFSITTIQPLDMFPQTHHIENMVLLEKN